ncbi:MAG: hypothetical protein NT167_13985 [Verrucomicrobia bacterium]|nr:hypothetical protein [Verrucomicrobiota bacterium]
MLNDAWSRRQRLLHSSFFILPSAFFLRWGVAVATALSALAAFAADPAIRTPLNDMLLLDSLGRAVKVATNQLPH